MPLHLTLLGHTDLTGDDGRRFDKVLAQPKRLALLAYLALGKAGRMHRRDSLLLLFWPESDDEHARGALSQSLSFLRRELGDGVIATRGTEEVGIVEGAADTDVARCDACIDAGDAERAVLLFGADLLVGFHLAGCNEFDDWLAAERLRVHERAAKAARDLAKRSAETGTMSRATETAQAALLLSPLDERAAHRLMLSYQRAGRPALAVHAYDAFRDRLRRELGVQPSAELQQLAEALRGTRSV